MELASTVTEQAGWTVVTLSGELDMATAPTLRERLHALLADGSTSIVVDLDGVGFLDSTGLGVLVGGLKRARAVEGDLRLACGQPRLNRVFELTRLDAAFTIRETTAAAIAAESPRVDSSPGE